MASFLIFPFLPEVDEADTLAAPGGERLRVGDRLRRAIAQPLRRQTVRESKALDANRQTNRLPNQNRIRSGYRDITNDYSSPRRHVPAMKPLRKITQHFLWIAAAVLFVSTARADLQAGLRAYTEKDYTTAYTLLMPEAEKGNAQAQNLLGVMNMNGLGRPKDDAEAVKWYRLVAEQGGAGAQYKLGVMYANGHGVLQDDKEATAWFQKAAQQGNAGAKAYLRILYQRDHLDHSQRSGGQNPVTNVKPAAVPGAPSNAYPAANPGPKQVYEEHIEQKIQKAASTMAPTLFVGATIPAMFEVNQDSSGNVLDTKIITSSGNVALDTAVERAIRVASPLPLPAAPLTVSPQIIVTCCLPRLNNKDNPVVSVKIAPERLKDLRRVQELMVLISTPAMDPEVQLKQGLEAVATFQTHGLDPNNPKWNPSHPKWNAVLSRVRADTESDLPQLIATVVPELKFGFAMALGDHLTENDVDELLRYYRSDEGKHYLQFTGTADALLGQGMQDMMRMSATKMSGPTEKKEMPSKDKLEARSRILQMSGTFRIMRAQMESDKRNHRDTSGYSALFFFMATTIAQHGEEIDRLENEYKGDLSRFDEFNRSALASKQIEALSAATTLSVSGMGATMKPMEQAQHRQQEAWRQVYLSEVGTP